MRFRTPNRRLKGVSLSYFYLNKEKYLFRNTFKTIHHLICVSCMASLRITRQLMLFILIHWRNLFQVSLLISTTCSMDLFPSLLRLDIFKINATPTKYEIRGNAQMFEIVVTMFHLQSLSIYPLIFHSNKQH